MTERRTRIGKQSFAKANTIFFPFFDRMVGSESTGDYNLEIQDIRENILKITVIYTLSGVQDCYCYTYREFV
jgi:hypothetical protein